MNFGIDWSQAPTLRGIIWMVASVIGLVMVYMGKDVSQLILLAGGIAGGVGVAVKDK
jgi:hypothetical protein